MTKKKVTANISPSLLEDFPISPNSLCGCPGSSPWLLQGYTSGALRAHFYKSSYLGLRDELWELREPSEGIPEIKVQTILHTGV